MAAIKITDIINLTESPLNIPPTKVRNLCMVNEPNNELVQYYMTGDDSTRLALIERDVEYLKTEAQSNRELRDTVINLKQSVELLNKTVWGVLACFGGAIVMIAINFIFGGVLK